MTGFKTAKRDEKSFHKTKNKWIKKEEVHKCPMIPITIGIQLIIHLYENSASFWGKLRERKLTLCRTAGGRSTTVIVVRVRERERRRWDTAHLCKSAFERLFWFATVPLGHCCKVRADLRWDSVVWEEGRGSDDCKVPKTSGKTREKEQDISGAARKSRPHRASIICRLIVQLKWHVI